MSRKRNKVVIAQSKGPVIALSSKPFTFNFNFLPVPLRGTYGTRGNLEKSGFRFSMKAFFPSLASSDM